MAGIDSLTDQIRGWFERTPKAQAAVKRLSEDLDVVAGHVDKATSGLLEKVGPIIDPPARVAAGPQRSAMPDVPDAMAAHPDTDPVVAGSEAGDPPRVKQDGEPIPPTT